MASTLIILILGLTLSQRIGGTQFPGRCNLFYGISSNEMNKRWTHNIENDWLILYYIPVMAIPLTPFYFVEMMNTNCMRYSVKIAKNDNRQFLYINQICEKNLTECLFGSFIYNSYNSTENYLYDYESLFQCNNNTFEIFMAMSNFALIDTDFQNFLFLYGCYDMPMETNTHIASGIILQKLPLNVTNERINLALGKVKLQIQDFQQLSIELNPICHCDNMYCPHSELNKNNSKLLSRIPDKFVIFTYENQDTIDIRICFTLLIIVVFVVIGFFCCVHNKCF